MGTEIVGIYSIPEAARLLKVSTGKLRRWANGYTCQRRYGYASKKPVLQTDRGDTDVIDFRELFELKVVSELRALEFSLEVIRQTANRMAKRLKTQYPLASQAFFISGAELLVEEADGLIRADTGQIVMDRIAVDMPLSSLRFDHDWIEAWSPPSGEGQVCLDPKIRLGDPVVSGHSIPTRSVFKLFLAEQDIEVVAEYFDLTSDQVKGALHFEQWLRKVA